MRGWWAAAILLCLVSAGAAAQTDLGASAVDPQSGGIADGVYHRNDYFGLDYKLPPDWHSGDSGPSPSDSGYYVLGSFVPRGEVDGMVLIAAQDMFFATPPIADAAHMTRRFAQALEAQAAMSIDLAPSELMIAGHRFSRVDFSGAKLHHAMFVSELRCHLLSFNLSANEPKLLEFLEKSLGQLRFARDGNGNAPICMKDYASAGNLLHRVEPVPTGPRFAPIPVRMIIGANGLVAHVHVIRATPQQRDAIERALAQWRFNPYRSNGVPLAIETGILFSFGAAPEALR